MAGKVRVHELARELGVTVKQLLLWLSEQGEFAKSGSSTLPAPVARRLREAHGASSGSRTRGTEKQCPGSDAQRPRHRADNFDPVSVEPPYQFVRRPGEAAAHHRDYLSDRLDRSLCGIEGVTALSLEESPADVCMACQDRISVYEASWWRDQYLATASELKQLGQSFAKLEKRLRNHRDPARSQKNAAARQEGRNPAAKSARAGKAGPITQYCVACKSRKVITGFDVERGWCAECRRKSPPHSLSTSGAKAKEASAPAAGPKSWKCPNCLKRIQVDRKRALVQHRNAKGQRCAGSGYQLPERSVDALDYRVAGSFESGRR